MNTSILHYAYIFKVVENVIARVRFYDKILLPSLRAAGDDLGAGLNWDWILYQVMFL